MEKFKVGDWLRHIDHESIISEIISEIQKDQRVLNGYPIDKWELWQPKEGEWCWFWNKHQNQIVDRAFEKFTYKYHGFYRANVGQWIKSFEQVPNHFSGWDTISMDIYSNKNCSYQYCEPFIGQLPSYLKGGLK